ncbi:hypothetical protein QZH41_013185 [Actinostola sp. cb2023]|nr:hypothetical protein QZH41_013185 [Actinostola sp. cb2023]
MKDERLCRDHELKQNPKSSDELESSVILQSRHNPRYLKAIQDYLGKERTWKRCFHSGAPGFNQTAFHLLCDSKGPTVTIVRVDDFIFGGYIDVSWKSYKKNCPSVTSDHAFLFSLYNVYGFKPYKFKIKPRNAIAAYHCARFGPAFGHGFDLVLYPGPTMSYTRCASYEQPPNCTCSAKPVCTFYTGKTSFIPSDVEVFYELVGGVDP